MIGKSISIRMVKWVIMRDTICKPSGGEPPEPLVFNSMDEAFDSAVEGEIVREVILSGSIDV